MKNKSKKRNKTKNSKKNINKDILGIIIVSIGILSLLSLFSNKTGVVGNLLKNVFLTLMGFAGYIFPLIIIFIGFCFILTTADVENNRKSIYLLLIFLCFIIILDIKLLKNDSFTERINLAFSYSQKGLGGGLIGGFLGFVFFKLFGTLGSYIILSIVIFVNFLLITEIKLKDLFSKQKTKPKLKSIKINNYNKNEEIKKSERIVDSLEDKNQNIKILDYSKRQTVETQDNYKDINFKPNVNLDNYQFPSTDLLKDRFDKIGLDDKKEILTNAKKIEETMKNFGVDANIIQISKGPTITCYELQPAPGVKVSKIVNLSDDISLNLATSDVRIEAPIPGKAAVGIEVPNKNKMVVSLKEMLLSQEYNEIKSKVPFALGKNIAGKPIVTSIEKMPHLLIAGATGSGKSVCINTIIMSILFKSNPEEVKLILIDPKVVELNVYNDIPHLLIPVVTDAKKAQGSLYWAVEEMNRRYKLFAKNSVRDIKSYNQKFKNDESKEKLPLIIIIIDELADLMMVAAQEIEDYICRLAQMARAAGMHLIVATQRPSVDVITGTIKANIPSRISFAVTSQIDSRTILDMSGAEKLLGQGDMLFFPSDIPKPVRIQGAFIDDEEVEEVVTFLKSQTVVEYDEELLESIKNNEVQIDDNVDELLPDAINLVIDEGQASISLLQRRLRVGYARAARMVDQMEERGIVGGYEGSKPRKVLVDKDDIKQ
ncbi:DNA translocase FtsK [Anaerosalibacter sp. Marseille-P3206]|uniref:DNA translocase FtsK n=1 Tax=Anaerosalibacter sp. Marseille-P3206 TaxID=1871005 RepID=UPI0009875FF2|nr:DNA translocase FtsK [Anaerosalibacter sp. Marseille-P3206]